MNERILQLRKTLKLNQEDFGKKIALSNTTISALEKGLRDATDRTVLDICREFSVNEKWLKTGAGDMFVSKTKDEELAYLIGEMFRDEDEFMKDLFLNYARLSKSERDIIKKFIQSLSSK